MAVKARFDEVDRQFRALASQFDEVDRQFKAVDSRFERVESCLQRLEVRLSDTKAELIRWNFMFWVAQLAAIATILKLLK